VEPGWREPRWREARWREARPEPLIFSFLVLGFIRKNFFIYFHLLQAQYKGNQWPFAFQIMRSALKGVKASHLRRLQYEERSFICWLRNLGAI